MQNHIISVVPDPRKTRKILSSRSVEFRSDDYRGHARDGCRRVYDSICAAIMQHLFDTLSQQYICTKGSDYVDCSFLNYDNAIEILSKKDLRDRTIVMPPRRLFILCQPLFGWSEITTVGAGPLVRIVLAKGALHIKSLLQHSVDIAEPNFASLTDLIQCKLQMVFMGDVDIAEFPSQI